MIGRREVQYIKQQDRKGDGEKTRAIQKIVAVKATFDRNVTVAGKETDLRASTRQGGAPQGEKSRKKSSWIHPQSL